MRGLGASEGISWGFWLVALVWWVDVLDLDPIELVLMGTVLELSVLLFETPTGVVADLVSRRLSIVLAHVVMGIGFIWAVASTNYWAILPAQAFFGIGWTFLSGADVAWVTDELRGGRRVLDSEIDRLLLVRHRFGIFVGLVTIAAVTALSVATSVRVGSVATGIAFFALAGYLAVAMPEEHFVPGRLREEGFVTTLRAGLSVVSRGPRLRIIFAVALMMNLGAEAFDRLAYDEFLETNDFGAEPVVVLGVFFAVLALAGLAANRAAQWRLDNGGGVARIAAAMLFMAAVGAGLAAFGGFALVIAFGIMTQDGMREALYPVLDGWANRDAPSEVRATVHSVVGQATSIGELAGGLLLGAVAQATSIPTSLAVAGGFFLAASAISTRSFEPRAA